MGGKYFVGNANPWRRIRTNLAAVPMDSCIHPHLCMEITAETRANLFFHSNDKHMKPFVAMFMLSCLLSCQDAPVNFEGGDPANHETEMRAVRSVRAEEVSTKQEPSLDRKLIKTGFLKLSVGDIAQTRDEIEKICKTHSAYISSESQSNYDNRLEFEHVIRIPAGNFDEVVKKLEGLGSEVIHRNILTQDVTEEFIDKEARIKTKRELENRYREILKQAKLVSDMLSIEAQLNHVRADIEAMEGRLTYLRNQVAYSTLTVSYQEHIGAESAFGSKTVAAFSNGWDMLLVLLIGLVNIWPLILLFSVILYFAMKRNRARRTPEPQ